MKKELALSWNSVAERTKYLSFGLYSMVTFLCYRIQTAFTVANQVGKFRAVWAYAVMVDYCAFWYSKFLVEVDHGRGFCAPNEEQHAIPDNYRPTLLSSRDNMVQTNVNTVMHNFVGSRELGSTVITGWVDRYDLAPPLDNGAADYVERLLIPANSRYIWRFNMHPREVTLVTLMWQQELDRPDATVIYGSLDDIVVAVLRMHWPDALADPALPWQQARIPKYVGAVAYTLHTSTHTHVDFIWAAAAILPNMFSGKGDGKPGGKKTSGDKPKTKGSGKAFSHGEASRRKRKAASTVLPIVEKSVKPETSKKMKKELALSWNSVAERTKYLSFGLYSMVTFLCYRIQTAFTVANQVGKFRAVWAYAVMVDYCAFWYSKFLVEVDHGRGFCAPNEEQHAIPDNYRPTLLSSRDNMVQTNVNTVMHNFVGSRELGSTVITGWVDRYDLAPPLDNGAADYVERLLIPANSRYIWRFNMHPREVTLVTLMWQQELDRPDATVIYGSLDDIVVAVLRMHWPDALADPALPWQQARIRPFYVNLWEKMARSEGASKAGAEIGYRGGLLRIVTEILANATQWHFGALAMTTRITDELTKACTADDKLHNVRMLKIRDFASRLDSSVFPYAVMAFEHLGKEKQEDTTFHSSVVPSESVNEVLSLWNVRTFPSDADAEMMALWQGPSKFCTPAYCQESAFITKANIEVARSVHFEYIRGKFAVSDKIHATPIDVSGEDLIASSKIDAAEEADVGKSWNMGVFHWVFERWGSASLGVKNDRWLL